MKPPIKRKTKNIYCTLMSRFCKHCGADAPNADQCGNIVGTRHVFVEGNTPSNQLSPPVNFIALFPSYIFHTHILVAFYEFRLMD